MKTVIVDGQVYIRSGIRSVAYPDPGEISSHTWRTHSAGIDEHLQADPTLTSITLPDGWVANMVLDPESEETWYMVPPKAHDGRGFRYL